MFEAIAEWFYLDEKLYFFLSVKNLLLLCVGRLFSLLRLYERQSKCIMTIITTTEINKYVLNVEKI